MDKNKKNYSRRDFLKQLGMGVGSVVAMASMGPLYSLAEEKQKAYMVPGLKAGPGNMTYRINHHTQDKVSLLGYGMMRLPRKADRSIDQELVNAEVDYALAHGINYFDTAPAYGESEVATGIALKRHPRDSYYIATKMSNQRGDHTLEQGKQMYENSLKRLQTDYIDYYLLHSIGGGDGVGMLKKRFIDNGLLAFLMKERDAGRIRNLGFSYHGDVKAFDWLLDRNDEFKFTFVQIEMNYIDWRHAKNGRKKDADAEYLYNKCEKSGVQCVVMEPLLGGRLARVPEEIAAQLKAVRPDATPASWAFRWVGTFPNILTALSGMTSMEVLKENVETFSPLDPCTESENVLMAKIADEMAGVPVIPCTACAYCMPCPYGVSIPENFSFYNDCVTEKTVPNDKSAPDYQQKLQAFKENYRKAIPEAGRAYQCVDCEECLAKCPQSIRIPTEMARLVEMIGIE